MTTRNELEEEIECLQVRLEEARGLVHTIKETLEIAGGNDVLLGFLEGATKHWPPDDDRENRLDIAPFLAATLRAK